MDNILFMSVWKFLFFQIIKRKKIKINNLINWKKEINLDENNSEKCFELPCFKYTFCYSKGKIYYFRPQENKPCFSNLNDIWKSIIYIFHYTLINKFIFYLIYIFLIIKW